MAGTTVQDLDDAPKRRLQLRAALGEEGAPARNLGTAIHELFRPFGEADLEIPRREPMREPPRFH